MTHIWPCFLPIKRFSLVTQSSVSSILHPALISSVSALGSLVCHLHQQHHQFVFLFIPFSQLTHTHTQRGQLKNKVRWKFKSLCRNQFCPLLCGHLFLVLCLSGNWSRLSPEMGQAASKRRERDQRVERNEDSLLYQQQQKKPIERISKSLNRITKWQ